MNVLPPQGSKISVKTEGADHVILVPNAIRGGMRYLVGLFLLLWLGGWATGFKDVLSKLVRDRWTAFLCFG